MLPVSSFPLQISEDVHARSVDIKIALHFAVRRNMYLTLESILGIYLPSKRKYVPGNCCDWIVTAF